MKDYTRITRIALRGQLQLTETVGVEYTEQPETRLFHRHTLHYPVLFTLIFVRFTVSSLIIPLRSSDVEASQCCRALLN